MNKIKSSISGKLKENPFIPDSIKSEFIKKTDDLSKTIIETIDQYFHIMQIPKFDNGQFWKSTIDPDFQKSADVNANQIQLPPSKQKPEFKLSM